MPQIRDSGIQMVTCLTEDSLNSTSEDGYYLRRSQDENGTMHIFAIIVENGDGKEFELNDHDDILRDFILQMIKWPENTDKIIDGKLGLALVNLIEQHPKGPGAPLVLIEHLQEQNNRSRLTKAKIAYGTQLAALVVCVVGSIGYGISSSSSDPVDSNSDGYIDPIFPIGYISASLALQAAAVLVNGIMVYGQNRKTSQLEAAHSQRRSDRDEIQTLINGKNGVKENIACLFPYYNKIRSIREQIEIILDATKESSSSHENLTKLYSPRFRQFAIKVENIIMDLAHITKNNESLMESAKLAQATFEERLYRGDEFDNLFSAFTDLLAQTESAILLITQRLLCGHDLQGPDLPKENPLLFREPVNKEKEEKSEEVVEMVVNIDAGSAQNSFGKRK